jgi:hypothetical protein
MNNYGVSLASICVFVFISMAHSVQAGTDTLRRVCFLPPDPPQSGATAWAGDLASSDATFVLGEDAPEFAWGLLDTTACRSNLLQPYEFGLHPGTSRNWLVPVEQRRVQLLYVDWLQHLPSGAQIESATLNLVTSHTWYASSRDTFCAVLMTHPEDSQWRTSRGVSGANCDAEFFAHATWSCQTTGLAVDGFPAADVGPWEPALAERRQYWDWGIHADWSAHKEALYNPAEVVAIDITNCVQAAVNGCENNGIMLMANEHGVIAGIMRAFHWEAADPWAGYRPWITVTLRESDYEAPYPDGADWAFVFSTDDGVVRANDAYAAAFAARDLSYSIYVSEIDEAVEGTTSWDDLLRWRELGMEIGSHSRWHNQVDAYGNGGLNLYDARGMQTGGYHCGCDPDIAMLTTGWDSLLADSDPVWLYDGAEARTGDRREDDLLWGKTLALPQNQYNPYVLKAVAYHGYVGMRCRSVAVWGTLPDGEGDYFTTATRTPAGTVTDTMRIGVMPHDPHGWRNLLGVPPSVDPWMITGSVYNGDLSEGQVRFNTRNAIERMRASHRRVLGIYVHDFRSEPGMGYGDGIDADEMEWILDEVQGRGGAVMNVGDYQRWVRSRATPIGTPFSFAQPDSFAFVEAQRVWYVPQGGVQPSEIRYLPAPVPDAGRVGAGGPVVRSIWPNPCNPLTNVRFALPRGGATSVAVYDLRGRRVQTLLDAWLEPGEHLTSWRGRDDSGQPVAAGAYIVRVESGGASVSTGVMLVK